MTDTVPAAARATQPRIRPFDRSLPMGLLRAREAAMRHFRVRLAQHDLTEQRWRVLRALGIAEDVPDAYQTGVGEIAKRTFLLAPSLSRILAGLEDRGLVQRSTDAADQRRSVLALTVVGRRLVTEVAPESEAIYAEIEKRFGAERLARLLADLRDLEAALSDLPIDWSRL